MLYLFMWGKQSSKKILFFKGCSAVVGMLVDIGMLMENKNINLYLSVCIYVCKGKIHPFANPLGQSTWQKCFRTHFNKIYFPLRRG